VALVAVLNQHGADLLLEELEIGRGRFGCLGGSDQQYLQAGKEEKLSMHDPLRGMISVEAFPIASGLLVQTTTQRPSGF
jgi:hypothetical protein